MIPALRTHTLPLSDLMVTAEDNPVSAQPAEETEHLKKIFDNFYRTMKEGADSIAGLRDSATLTSPDVLLQTQLALAKIHFREELLAKTVGKISQNIDTVIKSQ